MSIENKQPKKEIKRILVEVPPSFFWTFKSDITHQQLSMKDTVVTILNEVLEMGHSPADLEVEQDKYDTVLQLLDNYRNHR